jgi:hypothetical protein
MKQIFFISFLLAAGLFSCKDAEEVNKANLILFEAECNTASYVEGFVDRGGEIVQRTTVKELNGKWSEEMRLELQTDDKVLLFVTPNDGQTHLIKTAIYIDGELKANQDKVCHAVGGCSTKLP